MRTKRRKRMSDYVNVTELFGCDVFNDAVMEERLPKKVYKELKKTIEEGKELSLEVADVVAHEMKEWACLFPAICRRFIRHSAMK